MKKSNPSITFKALIGYLLLLAFGAATVWFIYNRVVELRNPADEEDNEKLTLISQAATRLYMAEGLSRNILQNKDTTDLPRYHKSIDTIAGVLDSLKTIYNDEETKMELDSIHHLLSLKEKNLNELLALNAQNDTKNYYDRVLKRLEEADYMFEQDDNYDEMVEDLEPYQKKVVKDYLEYAKEDNADRLTNRTVDSLVNTMKQVLLSLQIQEHNYQEDLAKKEDKFLANDLKISNKLRKIRVRIEREQIQESIAQMQSTQKSLNQTSIILIVFGIACVITILIFVILISRDTNRSQKYREALEEAKGYAEHLLESREQIMAAVTHDLRSPLNSILGYLELMRKTNLAAKQKSYLKQLKKSSDYTIRLVNDLLDFSRLEAGKIKIENLPFVPKDVIEDSVNGNIASPDPEKLNIRVSLTDDFNRTYLSDPFRLRQILGNLIGNAYKFTKEGWIKISGEVLDKAENKVLEICVEDTGIGMSKAQQRVIFKEFSQAEASTEKRYGGSGLGLAITQKLVHLLNGSISVESDPGKGSRFTVNIPVEETESKADTKEREITAVTGVSEQRILIIDDAKTQLNLTKNILENQGFYVLSAEDGKAGLEQVRKNHLDLIITDIQMPKMDGYTLIRELKHNKETRTIPVIALSGKGNTSRKTYLNEGFSDYLLKPYENDDLLRVIAKVLQLSTETSTSTAETSNTNSLYDLAGLKQFTDGDPDSLNAILRSFAENSADSLEALQKAGQNKNWERVAFVAHKMLPMFRQIKAKRAADNLEQLEQLKADNLNEDSISKFIEKSRKTVAAVLEALKNDLD